MERELFRPLCFLITILATQPWNILLQILFYKTIFRLVCQHTVMARMLHFLSQPCRPPVSLSKH